MDFPTIGGIVNNYELKNPRVNAFKCIEGTQQYHTHCAVCTVLFYKYCINISKFRLCSIAVKTNIFHGMVIKFVGRE
jgi:hypothetical protein